MAAAAAAIAIPDLRWNTDHSLISCRSRGIGIHHSLGDSQGLPEGKAFLAEQFSVSWEVAQGLADPFYMLLVELVSNSGF